MIQNPTQTLLAPWQYAGLMLSYWCPARCEFCYLHGSPEHTYWAEPEAIVDWWSQLEILARRTGNSVKIHLTGGEPFDDWDRLVRVLELARAMDLPPVEKI